MNRNNYIIRLERKEEQREVENLVRDAFWNVYRPGCLEHYVINQLRRNSAFIPNLNFVMEMDRKLIGQNMFMNAVIESDDVSKIVVLKIPPVYIQNIIVRAENDRYVSEALNLTLGHQFQPFSRQNFLFENEIAILSVKVHHTLSIKKSRQIYNIFIFVKL